MSPADIQHTAQHLRERDPSGSSVAELMEEIAIPWSQAREERVTNAKHGRGSLPFSGGLAQ